MISIIVFAVGLVVGVFGTVMTLVAADAHRFDSTRPRRPVGSAARHGTRARLLRITTRPDPAARRPVASYNRLELDRSDT